MFAGCSALVGTVPADKLWNNRNVIWTNTDTCFTGCSDEIRAQVPISWGGTASDNIIEKSDAEKIEDLQRQINEIKLQLQ
jgi:hypothetical protein